MTEYTDADLGKAIVAKNRVDLLKPHLPGISALITDELVAATKANGTFTCAHHGYAVLLEEVDELWHEIKKKGHVRDPNVVKKEAVRVAAMAIRFIIDIIENRKAGI